MKIGIDCRLWGESGVGRYIRNLIEQLLIIDRKNSYVLFVLSKDKENIKDQISKIKYQNKLKIGNWKLKIVDIRWHTLEEQFRFPAILNKENLDLVHFPYFSVPIFYNKPFVVTIHDLILHHFPTGEASTLPFPLYQLKVIGYKFVTLRAARRAKKIITVSNVTKDEIIDHLKVDPNKVVVTYEGALERSNIKNQISKIQIKYQKYFLYVGNAYPHKNLERLIEAFNLFCHPERSRIRRGEVKGSPEILYSASGDSSVALLLQNDIFLVLVGKEDYFYKRLKEKVRNMGLQKSVLFYGEARDQELVSLYRNAKALVLPSLMEGFGLPALEAMANKCLVLASNIASLKEICREAAIYFDPYDIKDIVSKIETVCSDDIYRYREKLEKAFKRAEMFSWEKMARETLKIYEEAKTK